MTLREQAVKNLLDFDKLMKKYQINYFLMDGTLLGLYRDGDLIAGDYDDIDVGMTESDWKKISQNTKIFKEEGFQMFKSFVLNQNQEGMSIKRWANHIDIFLVHKNKEKGEAFNLGRNCCRLGSREYMAYVYPLECFEKFNSLQFEGIEFVIPSETDKFLSARYNEDWKKPHLRTEGFNMCSVEQNKALKGDYDYE